MGKLTITGKAKREVAYDTAILSVRFNTHSNTSAEALKTITKQSEEFLNILNDSGISAESIQLGDSHVDQDYAGFFQSTVDLVKKAKSNFDLAFWQGH